MRNHAYTFHQTPLIRWSTSCVHCSLSRSLMSDHPWNYLGLPTLWGRSKSAALAYFKERFASQTGKAILIKAVASAVVSLCPVSRIQRTFVMISFPGKLFVGVQLNGETRSIGIAGVICANQTKVGRGLGLDSHHYLALIAKQVWRLIQEPECLWARVIKAIYFPDCKFSRAKKGHRASSWGRSSMIEARDCGSDWCSSINI